MLTKTACHFSIPVNWSIDDYKKLDYKLDHHKGNEDNKKYIEAGHLTQSLTLYNYFEPNPMPNSIKYIKSYFNLKNMSVAVNLFTPGQYIPIHYDRYSAYKQVHRLNDDSNIGRYIVMLEDSYPGQMLQINNDIYNNWSAGDVFGWINDTVHTFYNLSVYNRYAVQITGELY